jgi:AcrR family transcriptional regulator
MASVRDAFLAEGFERLTMAALAERCGVSRRGLYNYFDGKTEAFCASVRWTNERDAAAASAAAEAALAQGEPPEAVLSTFLDGRFGVTRRDIGASAHGQEINDAAFRLAAEVMAEAAAETNRRLAALVAELAQRGALKLRGGLDADAVGRLVGDAARGLNQARPPIPNRRIAARYREMVEGLLYGCAHPPG